MELGIHRILATKRDEQTVIRDQQRRRCRSQGADETRLGVRHWRQQEGGDHGEGELRTQLEERGRVTRQDEERRGNDVPRAYRIDSSIVTTNSGCCAKRFQARSMVLVNITQRPFSSRLTNSHGRSPTAATVCTDFLSTRSSS